MEREKLFRLHQSFLPASTVVNAMRILPFKLPEQAYNRQYIGKNGESIELALVQIRRLIRDRIQEEEGSRVTSRETFRVRFESSWKHLFHVKEKLERKVEQKEKQQQQSIQDLHAKLWSSISIELKLPSMEELDEYMAKHIANHIADVDGHPHPAFSKNAVLRTFKQMALKIRGVVE